MSPNKKYTVAAFVVAMMVGVVVEAWVIAIAVMVLGIGEGKEFVVVGAAAVALVVWTVAVIVAWNG